MFKSERGPQGGEPEWRQSRGGQALAASLLAHAIALVWLSAPTRPEPIVLEPAPIRVRLTSAEPAPVRRAPSPAAAGPALALAKAPAEPPAKPESIEPKRLAQLEEKPAVTALEEKPAVRAPEETPPEVEEPPPEEPLAMDPGAQQAPEAAAGLAEEPEPEAYADIEMDIGPDGRVIAAWVTRSKPEGAAFVSQALSSALSARFPPQKAAEGEAPRRKKFRAIYESGTAGLRAPAEQVAPPPGASPLTPAAEPKAPGA